MGYNRCPLFIKLTEQRFSRSKIYKDKPKLNSPNWSGWSLIALKLCLKRNPPQPKNCDKNLVISKSLMAISFNQKPGIPSGDSFLTKAEIWGPFWRPPLINIEIRDPFSRSQNWKSHLAIPQPKQQCLCGLIMMGDLPEWKRERVVSFFRWPTQGEEWPYYYGWPTQVKKWRMVSLYGWPTQKNNGLIVWVTYPEKEWSHCMGDLPRKKEEWSHFLGDLPRGRNGLILMGDLPR